MEGEDARAMKEVFGLVISMITPAAITATVELNVPDILASAGPGAFLSVAEILSQVPGVSDESSALNLERILRFLAHKNVFEETLGAGSSGAPTRRYGLTPLSQALVKDRENRVAQSMVSCLKYFGVSTHFYASCCNMTAAVMESTPAFTKAHGMPFFNWHAKFPEVQQCFQDTMSEFCAQDIPLLLEKYDGFKGIKTLMDVGGGNGVALKMIKDRYPHINTINFDLPNVIANAPPCPGVEHVPGDMFDSIPSGCDAIFLKFIMHDWDDKRCIKLLHNCYHALPSSGKLIMVDVVMPDTTKCKGSLDNECAFGFDMMMLVFVDGMERDAGQWQALATKGGFGELKFIKLNHLYVVEAIKP